MLTIVNFCFENPMNYDLIIKNGQLFDGSGEIGIFVDIGIKDGVVANIAPKIPDYEQSQQIIDAKGCWVTPGFLEMHSHYDAELVAAPALKESVRHGVTTVATGLCSLSMVASDPIDCADLFSRVESIPHQHVLGLLESKKNWSSPKEYRRHLDSLPLGPNVACYLGHSDIRTAVMGIEQATTHRIPTKQEMERMESLLLEALQEGFLGMSVMTTKIDRVAGERAWSRPLPSTFARWTEFRRFFRILRQGGAILQGAPDVESQLNTIGFMWESSGWFRPKLRTTLLTALDLKVAPFLHVLTRLGGWVANRILGGNFRWQFLPAPLRIYSSGLNLNNFDEFAGGLVLRNMKDPEEQYNESRRPEFRALFKEGINTALKVGLWNRDFSDAQILKCPDQSVIGKSFADIAKSQGKDTVDCFLDLAFEYRDELVWTTLMGNNRPNVIRKLMRSKQVHVGFADSGAHLKGLAFYNFSLRFLKYARDAELQGRPIMSTAQAVKRVTSELAQWYGLDAGVVKLGGRADLVVVNPNGLDESLDQVSEDSIENTQLMRLVNRNDDVVVATVINGNIAYSLKDGYSPDLGIVKKYGRFLPRTSHLMK